MSDEDVPSPIDLRDPKDARQWAATAEEKRPWRPRLRETIAATLRAGATAPARVLELGPGPGWLAETILRACPVERYTLFDFSLPMLEMSRERLAGLGPVTFVHGDFRAPGWTDVLPGRFDAIVAMQSVHEIRHKRHFPGLYRQLHSLLAPGGRLLVCDHSPSPDKGRFNALCATPAEQHAAFQAAGFERLETILELERMYICSGRRAGGTPAG